MLITAPVVRRSALSLGCVESIGAARQRRCRAACVLASVCLGEAPDRSRLP